MKAHGIVQSMSRKGNCWDNAPMESFLGSLKAEFIHEQRYPTHETATRDLFACIEGCDNRQRLHAALGCITPEQAAMRTA